MRYADVVRRHRPRGLWLLDEPGGTIAADQVRGLGDSTYSASGLTFGVPGPSSSIPRGIATDGVAGMLTFPSLASFLSFANPQSWEAWARNAVDLTTSTARTLFGNDSGTTQALSLGGDATGALANEVSTILNDAGGANQRSGWSGFIIPAGWHHHVWTYNGNQHGWSYFLDGTEILLRSATASLISAGGARGFSQGSSWKLARVVTFFSAWAGLAAAAVYDSSLSPAQVAENYVAGRR